MDKTVNMELEITYDEYKEIQMIFASVSMTVEDGINFFLKALCEKEKEILFRYENGESAEKILDDVASETVEKLFGIAK